MPDYDAGSIAEYVEGDRKVLVCGDVEVGVFLIDGQFYAWRNHCWHRGGPVCQGRILKRVIEPVDATGKVRSQQFDANETHIVCPRHGYEFNIKTGRHPGNAAARLRKVEIKFRDGNLYVSL